MDELADSGRDAVQRSPSGGQFPADGVDVDLGKAFLQSCVTVEQDFEVSRVVQVPDQRRVGNHGLQQPADRVLATFSARAAPKIPEETFHQVVGTLGLNE